MTTKSYQSLQVWQRSMALVKRTYLLTQSFPDAERYGLMSQMRRCAVSVPSNIAEGHNKDSSKEYLRHVSISFGSLAELETQLLISLDLNFGRAEDIKMALSEAEELGRMLRGLQRAMKEKIEKESQAKE